MALPSCSSRKFPCEHGLGLYLLKAADPGLINSTDEPQWVSDWLGSRQARQEKKAENAAAANTQDPAIAAAQARKREDKIDAGMRDADGRAIALHPDFRHPWRRDAANGMAAACCL